MISFKSDGEALAGRCKFNCRTCDAFFKRRRIATYFVPASRNELLLTEIKSETIIYIAHAWVFLHIFTWAGLNGTWVKCVGQSPGETIWLETGLIKKKDTNVMETTSTRILFPDSIQDGGQMKSQPKVRDALPFYAFWRDAQNRFSSSNIPRRFDMAHEE